ncbi:HDOD domain-containing protein [Clostridium botulinum]|uniref:Stage 0 sporulation protein A homolog n=1 Tax=Clostridium botulinum D str. 1873 TaxID=592027 RepID=A0A9P2LKL8_CLOBO|nr:MULTISPECIES: response regulator [Clostridium]AYF55092.1 HDOD domain-containing protein [Clostridium novyi]EES90608.1 response regulator receiver protein [Clostridium botulinum D str. 1873]MBO3442634.1 HDOD domain-containing protein [Clostridium haemolyticum]MCD3216679.1 HDOD domain-containing protein [Clostridium botulinum C]MCD3244527.1 HDOD domain-containing protein [Clostridium botulinum C]
MSKSILFVDDERLILRAIKREMWDSDYETFYANNGAEALKILYENNIDMIVSDIKMPEMDGHNLLKKVKYLYPNVIRIALSGYADKNMIIKVVDTGLAKVHIKKPWDNDELINVIFDVFENIDKLNSKNMLRFLEESDELPTLPYILQKINNVIENEDCDLKDIVDIVSKDQTLSSKVLKTINSAFYGVRTGSINTAILNLGLLNLKSIILATEIFQCCNNEYNEYIEMLWQHSVLTNLLTNDIYKELLGKKIPEEYLSAALLHDIGKVIFLKIFKDKYQKIMDMKNKYPDMSFELCEKNIFDITHTELGAYVLNWWQMPNSISQVSMYHQNPIGCHKYYKEIVSVVHIADYLSWKTIYPSYAPKLNNYVFEHLNISKFQCEKLSLKYAKNKNFKDVIESKI